MDTFIKELKLEEIPDGPWKQVAEQIGVENLYTVLRIVGGGTTYIPKAETLIRPVRNRQGDDSGPRAGGGPKRVPFRFSDNPCAARGGTGWGALLLPEQAGI